MNDHYYKIQRIVREQDADKEGGLSRERETETERQRERKGREGEKERDDSLFC